MTPKDCDGCSKICEPHAEIVAEHNLQESRIKSLEEIVKDIPRMQARVNTLMQILIASMVILISLSGFSFLQLLKFKEIYNHDKEASWEMVLEQERRYVDLINQLGERVTSLEGRHVFRYTLPSNEK